MLESHVLVLHLTADGSRAVVDGATGTAVGFTRCRPASEQGWWRCLLGPVLNVHEQEEEPLVFTVRRSLLWWTQREVLDAEGMLVGYVSGRTLRDRAHRVWAWARGDGDEVVYEGAGGDAFASLRRTAAGIELAFAKRVEEEPFAKMLLLAAALLQPHASGAVYPTALNIFFQL